MVLKKTFESPLNCKEIKPANPKGNQSWIFIGAETEAPTLWPTDTKNWLIAKDPDTGRDWRQKGKAEAEDGMIRQHYQLNGREFEKTSGDGGRQRSRSLACCSPWGWKVRHNLVTEKQQNYFWYCLRKIVILMWKIQIYWRKWCLPLWINFKSNLFSLLKRLGKVRI